MVNKKYTIAVLSGKGGTGKTLMSVNLANVAKDSTYIDCDVEEPNGHLFFKPSDVKTKDINVLMPNVDEDLCNGCRKCVDFCKFNALAYVGNRVKLFDTICHSCGGCAMVCPQNAIEEKPKPIGKVSQGMSGSVNVITGSMNEGEASGVPIINELLNYIDKDKNTFIDCPPGSACTVMESIKDADFCVAVAEPTVFGVHNLNMIIELLKVFDKKFGVVINKSMEEQNLAYKYCKENNIDIIGDIPFDKNLGLLNSNGKIISNESDEYREIFSSILDKITAEVI